MAAKTTTASKAREFAVTLPDGTFRTRQSNRAYSHASLVRWSDGTVSVGSWHISEAAACKGVLTAQQKRNGAAVIGVLPVRPA